MLTESGCRRVTVPRLHHGDSERKVVGAYLGVLMRSVTDNSYKQDKQKGDYILDTQL